MGVSGDGIGSGGNLGQITLEDIRFVGGDPINSNDLFVKDEPAWDARQNFIEGKKNYIGILKVTQIFMLTTSPWTASFQIPRHE